MQKLSKKSGAHRVYQALLRNPMPQNKDNN